MKQQMKAVAKKEVKTHEKKMHGMKCGGKVKKYAEGGDIPTKAQKEEMRGQVQDARNKKAAEDYQKNKKTEKKDKSGGLLGGAKRGLSNRQKQLDEAMGMKKGGKVKKYAKGGGVEHKGKTKGKLI